MSTEADFTRFKGVRHIGNDQLLTILEANLKAYLDWSLLGIGGWIDVDIPQSGIWGADQSVLRAVNDPAYVDGRVWEGVRKDWVWETGVDYISVDTTTGNPQAVGTPEVDGTPTVAPYAINYPLGRIIFDSAISPSATVKVEHAYRYAQVHTAVGTEWWQEIQPGSFRNNDAQISETIKGDWSIGSEKRVQLPAVVVEGVSRANSKGYELGNGSLVISQDVLFNVIAENRYNRNKLVDIIRQQSDKTIWLFDTNTVNAGGDAPLDANGALVGSKMYPDLVDTAANGGYRWNKCRMTNAVVSEVEPIHPSLYEGVVRTTMEVVLGGI